MDGNYFSEETKLKEAYKEIITYLDEDTPCSITKYRIIGKTAEIHNTVLTWNRDVAVLLYEGFLGLLEDLRDRGVTELLTYSTEYNRKMQKYWNLFGFTYMGCFDLNGKMHHYAMMEI